MIRALFPLKLLSLFAFILVTGNVSFAQNYSVTKGNILFNIATPAGKLEAVDSIVTGYVNLKTGETSISCVVNDFHFTTGFRPVNMNETATQRFRDYYLETDRYPKATFRGKLQHTGLNFSKDGSYKIQATGTLTLHGVTKKISFIFLLTIKGTEVTLHAAEPLSISDYNIRIPANGISYFIFKEVNVQLDCVLQKK